MSESDSSSVTRTSSDVRTGITRKIKLSKYFQYASLGLILASTVFQGVDEDYNTQEDEFDFSTVSSYWAVTMAFTILFTIEIIIRILAWPSLRMFLKDREEKWWNRIDFVYLIAINFETWILPAIAEPQDRHYFKPIRLIRLIRVIRIFQIFPDLMILVSSMALAIKTVVMVLLLEVCFMWLFSIIYVNWVRSDKSIMDTVSHPTPAGELYHYLGSCASAMFTFLQLLLHEGSADIVRIVNSESAFAAFVLFAFSAISGLLIYNILIGAVCRVVFENTADKRNIKAAIAIREWMKRFDKLKRGWLSMEQWKRAVHKLQRNEDHGLDLSRLESARFLSTSDTEEARIEISLLAEKYVKLCHRVETQDILLCQTDLEALYTMVHSDIFIEKISFSNK